MDKFNFSFGIIIAYLLPGFIGLYSISPFSATVSSLLLSSNGAPSLSAIIPIIFLSLTLGMIINAIGFSTLRKVLLKKGIDPPSPIDYSRLTANKLPVLQRISDNNYRYFECYCNLFISICMLILSKISTPFISQINEYKLPILILFLVVVLIVLYNVGYYAYSVYSVRMKALLGEEQNNENSKRKEKDMYIGDAPK